MHSIKKALDLISEAFLIHQVSLHRRAVYRHINGDIAINSPSISAFIDGYLSERWSPEKRAKLYLRLIDFDAMESRNADSYLIYWGEVAKLKPRGIKLINAMFNRFGFMAEEMGREWQLKYSNLTVEG